MMCFPLFWGCRNNGTNSTASKTYTVGGIISGLDGEILLRINGSNGPRVFTNGTFTLSPALKSGTTYTVTVFSAPSYQTCTVTNSSGTVRTANVTNVQIACTNKNYTVGGTVTGLSGTALLQNNGGDDLAITANGPFMFETTSSHGTAFRVTVSSQPLNQTCTVTYGSGIVIDANVTSIQISCTPNIVVNSLEDMTNPPFGTVTLRSALQQVSSGKTIGFAPALNGGVIQLTQIADNHSMLPGEVYEGMTYQGYFLRDYGKSALYAQKDVVIDASNLPAGIIVEWTGGDANPARVLAIYGNLTLRNVALRGGFAMAEAIDNTAQPFTLARGGGLAVWGVATLEDCIVAGNRISGDENGSRDRGTYGGGIYAAGLMVKNCIISGNSAIGYGAAGGGVYSVGRNTMDYQSEDQLRGCTISGNRVTGQHAYGGGLFSLGGGPEYGNQLKLSNCTIARNLVEDHPGLANAGQFYFRGGGIYMGGGSLEVTSCTIVENEVSGQAAVFNGSPNIGGGGVAATIGNAHVVDDVDLQHSLIAGNIVNGAPQDWFSGSLLHFISHGYNRIGLIDFSRILAPAPGYDHISRKHYPKIGDLDGVVLGDVLAVDGAAVHPWVISAASDAGQPAVLWYPPHGSAVDQIPPAQYNAPFLMAAYLGYSVRTDDFLSQLILKLRTDFPDKLGPDFGASLGDLTGVTWYEAPVSWPSDPANAPWIATWRNLDVELNGRLGQGGLGDWFWETIPPGSFGNETYMPHSWDNFVLLVSTDQLGQTRPSGDKGDIGAIENNPGK